MTPAIELLKKQKCAYQVLSYQHDSHSSSYGLEAAEKLQLAPDLVFKTLVVQLEPAELVVAILPVSSQLDLKALAKVAGSKKAAMANPATVERSTGYVLGGVSPLGQKKRLRTFIDHTAAALPLIYVSAGRRGLEIALASTLLQQLLTATFAEICQHNEHTR
jgi:Cys-tRNA(Pro)/Cys-tRNA(Cys) deacylase